MRRHISYRFRASSSRAQAERRPAHELLFLYSSQIILAELLFLVNGKFLEVVPNRLRNLIANESVQLRGKPHRCIEVPLNHIQTNEVEIACIVEDHLDILLLPLSTPEQLSVLVEVHVGDNLQALAVLFSFRCFYHTRSISEPLLIGNVIRCLRDGIVRSPLQEPLLKKITLLRSSWGFVVLKLVREEPLDVCLNAFYFIHQRQVYRNPY